MEKVAKWVVVIALFLVPFIPLYVEGSLYFPFISGKGFAFRILVEIALGAWLLLVLIDSKYRPRFSWPAVILTVLVAWMYIADLFAVNPDKAFWSNMERMDGWVMLVHVFLFFIISSAVFTEKLWRNWWNTFLAGVFLVCSVGAMQLIGLLATNQGLRMDSSFGNPIYLANYMLFALPITIWVALSNKNWWIRLGLGVLFLLEVLALFYSETRGAFVGVFVAAIVAAFLWMIGNNRTGKNTRIISVAVLAGLFFVGGGLFAARETSFIQQNPELNRLSSVFSANEFATRFVIWDMAVQGGIEKPLFGWGQEGFNYVFNKYYNTHMYGHEQWFDRAHNTYLDYVIAGGFPAAILFVLFLISLFVLIYRSSLTRNEKILFSSAILAYSISALSIFDNLFTYVPLLAITAYLHSRESKPIHSMLKWPVLTSSSFQGVAAIFIGAGTFVLIYITNIPTLAAAQTLIQAIQVQPSGPSYNLALFKKALTEKTIITQEGREQLVVYASNIIRDPNVSNDTKVAIVQFALSEVQQALLEAPYDARLRAMASALYAAIGDKENSLAQIDAAIALSPKKQTLYIQKGTLLWQFDDTTGARDAFSTAYQLDTSSVPVAAYSAAGALLSGEKEKGFALLQTVFGTTTVNNDALFRAYYQEGFFDELVAVQQLRVTLSNGAPEERLNLAAVLHSIGKKEEALLELTALAQEFPELRGEIEQFRAALPK